MADYQPLPQRFICTGLSLLPADALPPGKFPYLRNVRPYEESTLAPRPGWARDSQVAGPAGVHTLLRLNDPTSFAPTPAQRFAGADVHFYASVPNSGLYTQIDTGYSGDPISGVVAAPVRSPQPWLYLADRSRQRKVNTARTVVPIGIAPPTAPTAAPQVALAAPGRTTISDFDAIGNWGAVGTGASAPAVITRVDTTIDKIVYDSGANGYASIAAADMGEITVGTVLRVGGAEDVLVTDVVIPVAATTVAAVIYDAGTTGLCTIQPAGSLGMGQLEGPSLKDYQERYRPADASTTATPMAPSTMRVTRIRQVDFPVNCLIDLNGETVRIESVALGPDGVQSFRCRTTGTITISMPIMGRAGFRAATAATWAAGATLSTSGLQHTITPTETAPSVGGLADTARLVDLARVGDQATQPFDDVHLAVRVDKLTFVKEIRVFLNVDAGATKFLNNYCFHTWRANDILAAIQATNAAVTDPLQDARLDAILQDQIDQPVADEQPPLI